MKTVYLYGYLKEQYGEKFTFDVDSPQQALSALIHQLKGFKESISEGAFHVIRGPLKGGYSLDETGLQMNFGKTQELHLMPALEGAKSSGGVIKTILGVALIGVAIGGAFLAAFPAIGPAASLGAGFGATAFGGVSYGSIAAIGFAVTALGVASLLTSPPQVGNAYQDSEVPEERSSFLFHGAVNQSTQGQPVPLVYGRFRTGSMVVSAGLTAEAV